jgi:hypothetical protein
MHACMYVYVYMYVYVCMYVYICMYVCMHACMYVYACIHMYVCMCVLYVCLPKAFQSAYQFCQSVECPAFVRGALYADDNTRSEVSGPLSFPQFDSQSFIIHSAIDSAVK